MPSSDGDRLRPGETERERVAINHHMNVELGTRRGPVAKLPLVTVLPNADVAVS